MYRLLLLSLVFFSCSEQKEIQLEEDVKTSTVTTYTDPQKELSDARAAEILNETLLDLQRDSSKVAIYSPKGNFKMPVLKPDSSVNYTILLKKLKAG
jgi:hypothetical protein